jgi:hypothetical protein
MSILEQMFNVAVDTVTGEILGAVFAALVAAGAAFWKFGRKKQP